MNVLLCVHVLCVCVCVCREREKFLNSMRSEEGSPGLSRNHSVPWAFIDDTDGGDEV